MVSSNPDHTEKFWSRLADVNAGMLGLASDRRFVPMSHYADRPASALWFITAKETDLAKSAAAGPQDAVYTVSDAADGLYATLDGSLSLSDDKEKLEELWNAVAASWFEDGRQDDDVQLMRLQLRQAEIWLTGGSVSFLYEIAKSKVTGDAPKIGTHTSLSF